MALANLDGNFLIPIGINPFINLNTATVLIDAVNEAAIFIGQIITADGGSHTIDTTGSSSLGWLTGNVTFASGTTVVKVGLAAVDLTVGPPARAVNASNVITFDVSKSLTGGAGGITANAWQTHVPDTGSKTIANGDFVAFAVQMTARGGTDAVSPGYNNLDVAHHRPTVTAYQAAAYAAQAGLPNLIITFADGVLGFFAGSQIYSARNTLSFNSASVQKEYGQLFQLPFPVKITGIYVWTSPDGDLDLVLYSNPLVTPVAEKTVRIDVNAVASVIPQKYSALFSSPYSAAADQLIVVAIKPATTTSIDINYKTIANAAHRIADPWGTRGYGVRRASGAFSNINSSLDHHFIGLLVGAFDAGGAGGGGGSFSGFAG